MGTTLVKILFTVGTTLFSEKVLINLLVILAGWAARKTTTDLDDRLVEAVKASLDTSNGIPQGNLYDKVKAVPPVDNLK